MAEQVQALVVKPENFNLDPFSGNYMVEGDYRLLALCHPYVCCGWYVYVGVRVHVCVRARVCTDSPNLFLLYFNRISNILNHILRLCVRLHIC